MFLCTIARLRKQKEIQIFTMVIGSFEGLVNGGKYLDKTLEKVKTQIKIKDLNGRKYFHMLGNCLLP